MPHKNIITKHFIIEKTIEDQGPPPPPPDLMSHFNTIQDWLQNVIDKDNPAKYITEFKFGLFQFPNDCLYLIGVNTYSDDKSTKILIEFKPSNMYFKLPKAYFDGLDRERLLIRLIKELRDFTNTEKFRTSFFNKAQRIIFGSNGLVIWSK